MMRFAALAAFFASGSAFQLAALNSRFVSNAQPLVSQRRVLMMAEEQEPMDLDLEAMFETFEAADKAIPDEPTAAPAAAAVNTMEDRMKSKALPFLYAPAALDGSMAGDVGFDPLGFSTAGNLKWMREAELKHGRLSMLAILGYVAVDCGLRFPNFAGLDFASTNSLGAHDAMVKQGPMYILFTLVLMFEALTYPAIAEMMAGETDRVPGDFKFDPLRLGATTDYSLQEVVHGRTAMLAFGGIVTISGLNDQPFPYF